MTSTRVCKPKRFARTTPITATQLRPTAIHSTTNPTLHDTHLATARFGTHTPNATQRNPTKMSDAPNEYAVAQAPSTPTRRVSASKRGAAKKSGMSIKWIGKKISSVFTELSQMADVSAMH